MFGVIAAGRMVRTDFQVLDDTHLLINLNDASDANHVVVFLTGTQPLPDHLGAAVHYSCPSLDGSESGWQYLGFISNAKPSAIFKITKVKPDAASSNHAVFSPSFVPHSSQLGISVEPLVAIEQMTPAQGSSPSSVYSFVEFVTKMLEQFMNYMSSYGVKQAEMTPNPTEVFVPLTAVNKWYENFQRRLQLNPMFWKH